MLIRQRQPQGKAPCSPRGPVPTSLPSLGPSWATNPFWVSFSSYHLPTQKFSKIPSEVWTFKGILPSTSEYLVHSGSLSHAHIPHTLKFSTLATLLSWVSSHIHRFLTFMLFHLLFSNPDWSDSRTTAFCEAYVSRSPFLFCKTETALVHRAGQVTLGHVSWGHFHTHMKASYWGKNMCIVIQL